MRPAQTSTALLPVLIAFGVLALAACTYYPFEKDSDEPAQHPVQAPAVHAATHRSAEHRSQRVASNVRASDKLPLNATGRIDGVVGLDEQQLAARLGYPAAREDRRPGTSWVYRDADCRLEISLYPDVRTHVYKVLSYEVISNADSDNARSRCVSKFADRVGPGQPARR